MKYHVKVNFIHVKYHRKLFKGLLELGVVPTGLFSAVHFGSYNSLHFLKVAMDFSYFSSMISPGSLIFNYIFTYVQSIRIHTDFDAMSNFSTFMLSLYIKPYGRCAPYLMGSFWKFCTSSTKVKNMSILE